MTRFRHHAPAIICLLAMAAGPGQAQTQIDLTKQSRNVDFSQASFTRPVKTGTALPPSCAVGDLFFKTDAFAGSNLYICTGPGFWNQSVGGPAPPASQLLDFQVTAS